MEGYVLKRSNDKSCLNCIYEYVCNWSQAGKKLKCDKWYPDLEYKEKSNKSK